MAIKWLTYVYIRAGGESPACSAQSVPSDAELYLEEHVTALQSKGRSGASPPAEFLEPAHRQRFEDLLCGHEQQFLAAATSLAAQVQAGLHGGTTDGLFVGLNGDASGIAFASVLKLEVTEKHRGALQDVAGGKIAISTVQNLLDKPGDRQKGVVVPDPRPDSSLIVGDRLSETALFFLSAIGARQAQKPALAAVEMAKVFQEVAPDLAVAMVERLTTSEARTPQEFLGQERELSAATRAQVMEKLTQ
ncbi:MAG TPA: hypothetical protein VK821_16005, partial [Dehalococcoidia bacterium]|nr:hypothetical protein [Dehalococcoidia bacterium]